MLTDIKKPPKVDLEDYLVSCLHLLAVKPWSVRGLFCDSRSLFKGVLQCFGDYSYDR